MMTLILNKILFMLFFLSCLNTIRHLYYIIQAFTLSKEEEPVKYKLSNKSLFLFGVSVSYILSVLITGIAL
jgi:hypothetical protein